MGELYGRLEAYGKSDIYPFHMPGHKRNGESAKGPLAAAYGLDITEIDGFDNLHQAEGILRREQERAAALYGAGCSYYLVNGSTCGILSAVFSVTKQGDRILMARNCHKSVYHAAYLRGLRTVYVYPGMAEGEGWADFGIAGAVEPEDVEAALRANPDCAAVILTSPTYEGVVSDVGKIADIAHSHRIPLIVDEAHGAHLGFHGAYPAGSVRLGADLVIHSVHKTLPAMTQTALLHWNHNGSREMGAGRKHGTGTDGGALADRRRLERYLAVFQTSSPSYVLMASVSNCMDMVEKEGAERLDRLLDYRRGLEKAVEKCRYVKLPEVGVSLRQDPCKLVIGVADGRMTGWELYDILLKKYRLQMEMAAEGYVLAIVTMMDGAEGWKRLSSALVEIDAGLREDSKPGMCRGGRTAEACREKKSAPEALRQADMGGRRTGCAWMPGNETVMTIAEAYDAVQEEIPLEDAAGRISAAFLNLYPPGIPLVAPGERLDGKMLETLLDYAGRHLKVQGVEGGRIRVVKSQAVFENRIEDN